MTKEQISEFSEIVNKELCHTIDNLGSLSEWAEKKDDYGEDDEDFMEDGGFFRGTWEFVHKSKDINKMCFDIPPYEDEGDIVMANEIVSYEELIKTLKENKYDISNYLTKEIYNTEIKLIRYGFWTE